MRKKLHYLCFLIAFLSSLGLQAQSIKITGKVTSAEDGSALPGVNISIKGKKIGTNTDSNGNYIISASKGDFLIYTFVGTKPHSEVVNGKTNINVVLESDNSELNEVVVTALGQTEE